MADAQQGYSVNNEIVVINGVSYAVTRKFIVADDSEELESYNSIKENE